MDYASDLVRESAEYPPEWDFSNWTFVTVLECTPEETPAVHDYGFELQRRAWAIVTAVQHQRDTADVNVTQVEARADRRRASAK